jgi:hypothetical protein
MAGSALHVFGDVALVAHGQGLSRAHGWCATRAGRAGEESNDGYQQDYSSAGG